MSQQIILFLLLQGSGSTLYIVVLYGAILALAYFMFIVPRRKQAQAIQEMLNNLKQGDKVVTNGGLYGTIVSVPDDKRTVLLKISENPVVRIEIARSAITGLQEAREQKS